VDGAEQAVRLRGEGRSTAQGRLPGWVERAARFEVVGLREGSTEVLLEAATLQDAAPERFGQGDLFPRLDGSRSGLDLFAESLADALAAKADSELYDDGLIRTFEGFGRVLRLGVDGVEVRADRTVRVDPEGVEACRRLRKAIPPSRKVRVAGKLDLLRHSDLVFTLVLEAGDVIRGVVAGDGLEPARLGALWGQPVQVWGLARFRPSGAILRVEAERIEPAGEAELAMWSAVPAPLDGPGEPAALHVPQGRRSGLTAIVGQWPGDETDEEVMDALDALS
jgi:hypothetical protein